MKHLIQAVWDVFFDNSLLEPQRHFKLFNEPAALLKKSSLSEFFKLANQHAQQYAINNCQPGSLLGIKPVSKMTRDESEDAEHLVQSISQACFDDMKPSDFESIVFDFMDSL